MNLRDYFVSLGIASHKLPELSHYGSVEAFWLTCAEHPDLMFWLAVRSLGWVDDVSRFARATLLRGARTYCASALRELGEHDKAERFAMLADDDQAATISAICIEMLNSIRGLRSEDNRRWLIGNTCDPIRVGCSFLEDAARATDPIEIANCGRSILRCVAAAAWGAGGRTWEADNAECIIQANALRADSRLTPKNG